MAINLYQLILDDLPQFEKRPSSNFFRNSAAYFCLALVPKTALTTMIPNSARPQRTVNIKFKVVSIKTTVSPVLKKISQINEYKVKIYGKPVLVLIVKENVGCTMVGNIGANGLRAIS